MSSDTPRRRILARRLATEFEPGHVNEPSSAPTQFVVITHLDPRCPDHSGDGLDRP